MLFKITGFNALLGGLIGGTGGGALDLPSDQIFESTNARDAFFVANPQLLEEGAQCVVLTSPPQGLYQVYTDGAWQDRSAVVVGPEGPQGAAGGGLVQVGKDDNFTEIEFIEIGDNLDLEIIGSGETGKAIVSGRAGANPSNGFALNENTPIATRLPDGTPVDFVVAPGLTENLLVGNLQQGMTLRTLGKGVYVQYDGGSARVILSDEGVSGINLTPLTESKYFNLQDPVWSTVIADHAVGNIAYFVQQGAGELFTGLLE